MQIAMIRMPPQIFILCQAVLSNMRLCQDLHHLSAFGADDSWAVFMPKSDDSGMLAVLIILLPLLPFSGLQFFDKCPLITIPVLVKSALPWISPFLFSIAKLRPGDKDQIIQVEIAPVSVSENNRMARRHRAARDVFSQTIRCFNRHLFGSATFIFV